MLEEGWNSFLIQWRIYKSSAVLSDEESKLQLIYCCEQELLEHILRSDPDITSKDEAEQLKSIKFRIHSGVNKKGSLNSFFLPMSWSQPRNPLLLVSIHV